MVVLGVWAAAEYSVSPLGRLALKLTAVVGVVAERTALMFTVLRLFRVLPWLLPTGVPSLFSGTPCR